jgi:hypothetical protein
VDLRTTDLDLAVEDLEDLHAPLTISGIVDFVTSTEGTLLLIAIAVAAT